MSALYVAEKDSWHNGGYFGTRNIVLAATLGSIGFEMRGTQPIMLTYNANLISKCIINKEYGDVEELADCNFVFAATFQHKQFGLLYANQIELCHAMAEEAQKRDRGDLNPHIEAKLSEYSQKLARMRVSETLYVFVKTLLDQIQNFHILSESVNRLANDPFIVFTKKMRKGLKHAIAPLETEKHVMNRAEKFMHS